MHCLRMAAPRARAGVAMCVLCVDKSVRLRLRTPCRPATVSAANSTEEMMQFCPLDLHSHLFGRAVVVHGGAIEMRASSGLHSAQWRHLFLVRMQDDDQKNKSQRRLHCSKLF